MNGIDILKDAAGRPNEAAEALRDSLTAEVLNAHVGGHANSVAWLLWHVGREIDAQVADLSGQEQVWTAQGFEEKLGLDGIGSAMGYGMSEDEARGVTVDEPGPLLDYVAEATEALQDYLGGLSDDDLGEVIDENWDPPVTRGVRLMSVIIDATEHVGQAAYVVGVPEKA